ncbi:hypothetical protein Tco_0045853 [Tanacetum coccineum]
MGRDTIQLENAVSTISEEYLLEFTSEYGILEGLHPSLPGPEDTIVDFPKGKVGMYTKFFEFANFRIPISQFLFDILGYYQIHISQLSVIVFPTVVDWHTSAPKDELPAAGSYHAKNVAVLNTRRTPIRKQPELLLCLVGLSQNYLLGDNEYPTFLYDDGREMDLFNLISAPNPSKVKTGSRPRAAHEVPLLTLTANWVIEMRVAHAASGSSGTPSTVERSPLDFDNKNPAPTVTGGSGAEETAQDELVYEEPPEVTAATAEVTQGAVAEEVVAAEKPQGSKRRKQLPRKRAKGVGEMKHRQTIGKIPRETSAGTIDPDPLSFVKPSPIPKQDITQSSKGAAVTGDSESEPSSPHAVGSPGGIYQPEWGVTNSYLLNTPKELAMGSQLRIRFEQEAKLLRKSVAQVARRDQRIQAIESEKNNLETLLEAEADMKKAVEARNTELSKELESLRARFVDLQVSHDGLFQQVSSLQAQVSGEEKIKASLEEFKRLEDEKVERRCAEMDARLDALSIDFDEELYPHMLTTIAGRRWVIGHGFHLAVMKCAESIELRQRFADVVTAEIAKGMSEGLKHEVDHGRAQLELDALEAYDAEADTKFTTALQSLKDLEYPLVDQLERLKDAPLDLIMTSLHLESDTSRGAPAIHRDVGSKHFQLKIPGLPGSSDTKDRGSKGGDVFPHGLLNFADWKRPVQTEVEPTRDLRLVDVPAPWLLGDWAVSHLCRCGTGILVLLWVYGRGCRGEPMYGLVTFVILSGDFGRGGLWRLRWSGGYMRRVLFWGW